MLVSGGVAQAAWSKNGSGNGYAKARTLAAPTGTAVLTCVNNSSGNNWTVKNWVPHATSTQAQLVDPSNDTAASIAFGATTYSWTTAAVKSQTVTVTIATTKGTNWTSSTLGTSPASITTASSNGKC